MSWLYLHLMTNHFPIILTLLGTAACLVGFFRKSHNAWLYGTVTLGLGGLAAIPSWITGYQAHYVVENRLWLPEGLVEPHEIIAEGTMWIMIPLAALAAFAWWRTREEPRRGPSPPWMRPTLLATGVAASILIAITAFQGGKINHGEQPRPPLTAADSVARAQQSFELLPVDTARPRRNRSAKDQ